MRKLLALIMALIMALGCASMVFADEAKENVVTIAMETEPCLDPHWNAGSTGAWLMSMMYEGLYTVNATSFELSGATDVSVSEDATVWTFKLRQDAVWSDGKPVTAADYVYSLQRLVDPDIATTYMFDYGAFIKNGNAVSMRELPMEELGVKAIDDYTLEITTQEPCTYFDSILTYSTFYPLRNTIKYIGLIGQQPCSACYKSHSCFDCMGYEARILHIWRLSARISANFARIRH